MSSTICCCFVSDCPWIDWACLRNKICYNPKLHKYTLRSLHITILKENNMERQLKQWWSTFLQISTKRATHLITNHWTQKKTYALHFSSVDYSISVQYYSKGKHVYFMDMDMLIRICDNCVSYIMITSFHSPCYCTVRIYVVITFLWLYVFFLSGCDSVSGFYCLLIYALPSEVQSSIGGLRSR